MLWHLLKNRHQSTYQTPNIRLTLELNLVVRPDLYIVGLCHCLGIIVKIGYSFELLFLF